MFSTPVTSEDATKSPGQVQTCPNLQGLALHGSSGLQQHQNHVSAAVAASIAKSAAVNKLGLQLNKIKA